MAEPVQRPRRAWQADPEARKARWALVRALPAASRPLTLAAGALLVVGAAMPVAFALASGAAVAAVPAAVAGTGGFGSPAGHRLTGRVLVVCALFLVQQVLGPVDEAVNRSLGRRIRTRTFRRAMAATLRPATIAHLEDPALLDQVAAATAVSPAGPASATASLIGQWRRLLGGAAALVLVARFHWWVAALLALTELHALRRNRVTYNQLIEFRVRHMPELRRAVYLRGLVLTPGAAKETRVFGLGDWVVDRFRAEWLGAMADVWRRRRGNIRNLAAAELPVLGAQLLALWLLGRAAIRGEIGLGALVAYSQAAMGSITLVIAGDDLVVAEGAATMQATASLERTVEEDPRLRLPGTRPAADRPRREIRFEGVWFRYPGQPTDVLRALDLTVPAGHSVAIVGDNGAGKTTLVKLLARLYDPGGGRILVDGVDLTELDAASWQQRVAPVFQDFVRYPLSAADNVTLGHAEPGPGALTGAARRAGALGVVEGLPNGWDTVLSREFEDGAELSGGEWQRVALARALFASARRGGGILVLDEPTAHLDARGEADFFDRFLEVTRGCTTVLISHRFSTVRRADRIVVLADGHVTESGTHEELLAAGGRYAYLFSLQASRFA